MGFFSIVALGAAGYAVYALIKTKASLEDAQYEISGLKIRIDTLTKRVDTLSTKFNKLNMDKMTETGGLRITADMIISDIIKEYPTAIEILAQYNLTGCSMCSTGTVETLAEAAKAHGANLEELLAALNAI